MLKLVPTIGNFYLIIAMAISAGITLAQDASTNGQPDSATASKPAESAEDQSAEATRGLARPSGPPATLGQGNRYALLIGIDYSPNERVGAKGTVQALHQCEKEATELKDVLINHYGYKQEYVKLFIGQEANRQAITAFLVDDFCKRIKPEDSVLVYFAGHGAQQTNSKGGAGNVYLWPVDVSILDDGNFSSPSAILLSEQIEYISNCLARQKLIILDCCYSGAVFQGNTSRLTDNDVADKINVSSIEVPAFQGISSTRAHQTASDKNSYTSALLKSLKRIHGRVAPHPQWNVKVFTASQLWRSSRVYLQNSGVSQSPQCRWLDRNDGEFLFFPDPAHPIPEEQDTQAEQALLLAMVPSSFGNWWMDEIPWFMPGLRKAIIEQVDASRGSVEAVPVPALKQAAIRLHQGNNAGSATTIANDDFQVNRDIYIKKRLSHMSILLDSTAPSRRKTVMNDILVELEKEESDGKLTAAQITTDLHFRANLLHKLNRTSEAEACYLKALHKYSELVNNEASLRPLESLCRLDYGWFLMSELRTHVGRSDLSELESVRSQAGTTTEELSASKKEAIRSENALLAAAQFSKARTAFGPLAPFPFQIFTLLQEARAQADAGRTHIGNSVLESALGIIDRFDPQHQELFTASVQKDAAWHYMIQWNFTEAEKHFIEARETINEILKTQRSDFAPWVSLFHIEHGLAMINRFQGNSEDALRQYRELTPRIAGKIRELDDSELMGQNYLEIRDLLGVRLCNSLERQGDCNFFSVVANYAEAADDYRRAAIYAEADSKSRYSYKRALALMLQGGADDVSYAFELLKHAKADNTSQEDRYVSFCYELAMLLGKRQSPTEATATDDSVCLESQLRKLIKSYRDNFGAQIPRDDLEILMFASRTLLAWQRKTATAAMTPSLKLDIERDADQLLSLCRLAHQSSTVELQKLRYLRPYYNEVFQAKLCLGKSHIKELIEVAWEAAEGRPFMKPPGANPLLVLFAIDDKQYFMLDNPNGTSELFEADEGITTDRLVAAATKLESQKLVFPDELRRSLRNLNKQTVAFQWRDASIGLGYNSSPALHTRVGSAGSNRSTLTIQKNHDAELPYLSVGDVTEYLDAPALPSQGQPLDGQQAAQ